MNGIKDETVLSSEPTLQEARARYEDLKTRSSRHADEFALSVAPQFGTSQFFYRRLLSDNTDPDIRKRAAISLLQMSEDGAEVDVRLQVKAVEALAELSDESPDIALPPCVNDIRDRYAALKKFHKAKLDRRWNDAYGILARYVEDHPDDEKRRLELGLLAYRSGVWGERASAIHALSDYPHNERAREALKAVETFFQARADSPGFPMDVDRLTGVNSPGSVFQHVLSSFPAPSLENREGAVMIAPSLAGGGAERIAATIFRGVKAKGKRIEMAIYEVEGKSGRDPLFYLPMTGLDRKDIQILDLSASLREPFTWLPPNLSRKAQAIHDFLVERRPHTVYLTLDMPNLAGGFAAVLAGVPNIILHCHNQRPSSVYAALGMEGWAAAYRSLLERPEVRMIAVSATVAEDYASWAGIDPGKIEVIRNGLDLNPLMRRDRKFLDALRSDLGIPQCFADCRHRLSLRRCQASGYLD
ncbi:glycosyltransferase family 4 protein [Paracoccus sp. DMF-8]|uniref:glycosyltransferase family 4 protein n=1 Tax=Paracoccus sp. DMF-8 TaxID=3019445 RepID=UPI0023E772BB|nr:glycosyltransferase family 4 protein [Paracoccus sp. DMF-8]MDF3604989.1 glycosyltransferase family 4 protein [Paracoccus sp. DMF-8]